MTVRLVVSYNGLSIGTVREYALLFLCGNQHIVIFIFGSKYVIFSRLKLIIFVNVLSSAFQRSLGFRLQKVFVVYLAISLSIAYHIVLTELFCIYTSLDQMNPNTDYRCLKTFGSYFSEDIRIPAVSLYVTPGLPNLVPLSA
jgi:hypothetical protein